MGIRPCFNRLGVQLAFAVVLAAAATALRWALGFLTPGILPFVLYFPGIIVASLLGGWRAGAVAGAAAVLAGWYMFLGPAHGFEIPTLAAAFNLLIFACTTAVVATLGAYMRSVLGRLELSRRAIEDQNLNYNALFENMSEGFSLCEAVRDESGAMVDYTVLEMNPALRRILGVGPEIVGARLTASPGDWSQWLARCDRVLREQKPWKFEYQLPRTGFWYEIHLNPVTGERLAQLCVDISDRKTAEVRQAGLFDELNHRVKNNLTLVSALLQLQARDADFAVREQLDKAAARVHSIAEVHAALYRGARRNDVDFGVYLQDLCDSLSKSLIGDDRIAIMVEAQSVVLPVDTAIPLGMVVNELVTNAVKYAYPAPNSGAIRVRFHPAGDGLFLQVGDEGGGLLADREQGRGGLGLTLVRSLVAQIHGHIDIAGHPGATFDITLPRAPATQH